MIDDHILNPWIARLPGMNLPPTSSTRWEEKIWTRVGTHTHQCNHHWWISVDHHRWRNPEKERITTWRYGILKLSSGMLDAMIVEWIPRQYYVSLTVLRHSLTLSFFPCGIAEDPANSFPSFGYSSSGLFSRLCGFRYGADAFLWVSKLSIRSHLVSMPFGWSVLYLEFHFDVAQNEWQGMCCWNAISKKNHHQRWSSPWWH